MFGIHDINTAAMYVYVYTLLMCIVDCAGVSSTLYLPFLYVLVLVSLYPLRRCRRRTHTHTNAHHTAIMYFGGCTRARRGLYIKRYLAILDWVRNTNTLLYNFASLQTFCAAELLQKKATHTHKHRLNNNHTHTHR